MRTIELPLKTFLSDPLLKIFLILTFIILTNSIFDFFPLRSPFFRDVNLNVRILVLLMGFGIALAGFKLSNFMKKHFEELRRCPLLLGLLIFVAFILIRPRINWGDSVWLVVALEGGHTYWNGRWLTSMIILSHGYLTVKPLMSPQLFLTLVYSFIGVISIFLTYLSAKILLKKEEDILFVIALIFITPATLMLSSGYIEIYSMVLFSLVIFITASIGWIHDRKWVNDWIYGLVVALTSLMYLGCLFLLIIGGFVFVIKILSKTSRFKIVFFRVLQYGIGNFIGFYVSAMILSGSWFISFKRLFTSYWELLSFLTIGKLQDEREFSFWESFFNGRVLEVIDICHLYGIISFILFSCILAFTVFNGEFRRKIMKRDHLPIVTLLFSITVFLGFFFYVKIPQLGFADWDVFMFLMYPMNFLSGYVICQTCLFNRVQKNGRKAVIFLKIVWLVFVFAYINPFHSRLNIISATKLKSRIFTVAYNYNLKQSLPKEILRKHVIDDVKFFK